MKISIDGQLYIIDPTVEADFLHDFQGMGIEMYRKQDDWLRFALKPVARFLLDKMETAMSKLTGKEKAASICRPPKKGDPVIHWSNIMMEHFQGALENATLHIEIKDNFATNFKLQFATAEDQAWRSVDSDRNERIREDNCAEVSGCDV